MKHALIFLTLLVFSCFFCGCDSSQSSEDTEVENNVLKEYINVPKDKARGAGSKLEAAQDNVRKQSELLEEE